MPSVKIPRKSTDFDMTPFVDVAFLILSFFMLATKFKPPEPVETTPPNSVSAQALPEDDAVLVTIDSANKVYFTVFSQKDPAVFDRIIQELNTSRNLNLSKEEMVNFRKSGSIGVPFAGLKSLLDVAPEEQKNLHQPGIPILDSATNELVWWVAVAQHAFTGKQLKYLIKGDGKAKYPTVDAVISALKRNEVFKYNLVTAMEDVPSGSDLDKLQRMTPVTEPKK